MKKNFYYKLKNKRRTALGRAITAVLFIAILLLAIFISYRTIIAKYASNVVSTSIQNLIKNRSGGLYVLSYDSIAIDVWKNSVYLKNFKIGVNADSTVAIKQHRVFDLTTQELRLDVGGLWSLWLTDELTIKNVYLNRPLINLIYKNKQQRSDTKIAEETGLLIKQLKENLNHLNIGFLEINNASISFFRKEINKNNLILEISDLSLDLLGLDWEIDKKIEGITSNTFFLRINNQRFVLPDSSAEITAAQITYSLKNNRLTFTNATLSPKNKNGVFADTASFRFNRLYFSGIDLNEVYQNNVLIVDSIKLEKPKFKLDSGLNYLSKYVQRKDSSTTIIDSLFVRNFRLDHGEFNLSISNIPIEIDQFNGEILNVSYGGKESGAFDYKNGKINLINGYGKIVDLHHAFSFDTLSYSSLSEIMKFDSLKIWSYDSRNIYNSPKVFANIQSLQIKGLNDQEIINDEITIDDIIFSNATIEIESKRDNKESQEKALRIPEILLSSLSLKKTTVSLKTQTDFWKASNSDIKIQNLEYGNKGLSINKGTSFTADLPLVNYDNEDVKIQAYNVVGSSSSELLKLSRITMKDKQIDVNLNQVLISNKGDWLSTSTDSLHFNFISFTDYKFDLKVSDKNQKSKTFKGSVQIDSLYSTKGLFSATLRNDEVIKTNIDYLTISELNSSDQTLNLGRYALALSDVYLKDLSNEALIKTINTSSIEETINLKELQLTHQRDQINDSINIASVSVSNFIIRRLPDDLEKMDLGTLKINNPLWYRFGNDENAKTTELSENLLSELHDIKLKEIKINNGFYKSTINKTEQTLKNINLQLVDIDLSKKVSDFNQKTDGFLYANSINATIDSLRYKSNSSYIQSANLKVGQDVELENLVYQNFSTDSIDIKTPMVTFKKVAYNKLFTNSAFEANDLFIESPEIKANFTSLKDGKTSNAAISVNVQNISINNASIDITTTENENLRLSPIDLNLSAFHYDSLTDFTTTLIPAESIELNTGKLIFTTSDGLNEIQVGKLRLSNNENTLTITNVNLLPLYQREEYMNRVEYQTDWIKTHIPMITVQGLNYRRFLKEKAFIADYVMINKPEINVYRDKNYPDSVTAKKTLPGGLLRNFSNSVDIDSLKIISAEIAYSEVPVKGQNPGVIKFGKLNATIQNITNIPSSLIIDSTANVHIESQVMNKIPVVVDIRYNLKSETDKFNISGKIAPHQLTLFNDFTEDGAFLKIKSGESKSLKFAATVDDELAIGTMYFEYSDLKIAFIDKKTAGTKKFEESIASFMANSFIVKKRNLALFRLRKGDIFFERNKQKSIFNYLSKLFISGVSSSVGFNSHKREIKKMKNSQP